MVRTTILTALLMLGGCATAPARLHVMPHDKDPNQSALCMAPNGEGLPWQQDASMRDPTTGEGYYTCPAPAFFVLMPRCAPGEDASLMSEAPEVRALRVRFGSDGSFFGDSYGGWRFCMPASPH